MKIYSSISILTLIFLFVLMIKAMDEFPSYIGVDTKESIFNFFSFDTLVDEVEMEKFIADLNTFKAVKNILKLKKRMKEKRVKVSSNEDIHSISAWQSEE